MPSKIVELQDAEFFVTAGTPMMPGAVDMCAHDCRRFFPRRATFLCVMLAALWVPNAGAATLDEAAEHYRRYLIEDIGRALTGVRTLRERLGANDLDGAKRAWIEARIGWERSE